MIKFSINRLLYLIFILENILRYIDIISVGNSLSYPSSFHSPLTSVKKYYKTLVHHSEGGLSNRQILILCKQTKLANKKRVEIEFLHFESSFSVEKNTELYIFILMPEQN